MKWKADRSFYRPKIYNDVNEPVGEVCRQYYEERGRGQEVEANVRLMESAPDMLHALETVQKVFQGKVLNGDLWDAMSLVSSVIKQAKGEGW